MREDLWPAYNPMGVLYNPASIAGILDKVVTDPDFPYWSIVKDKYTYHSMLVDSQFSSVKTYSYLVDKYEKAIKDCREKLEYGADLVITFGTAFVYILENLTRLERSEEYMDLHPFIVGNCHKLPSSDFSRRMLSVGEIAERWLCMIERIKSAYPSTRFIFTISPVRHLKDGFEGNSLSKATLRLSIEEIVRRSDPAAVSYFPAYEILNDDLRDYRFYGSDMVHPSDMAVEYIYDIFKETYIPESDRQLAGRGRNLSKGFEHRPIVEEVTAANKRINDLINDFDQLREDWPECLKPERYFNWDPSKMTL